jgi:ATP-dependent Clp protease ATP-binding subunit ClpC
MFERYTEKARRVIFFARYEASELGSNIIEGEHLLLGLMREDKGLIASVLPSGVTRDDLDREIRVSLVRAEKFSTSVDLPLSHQAKRILAYASEEAERLSEKHISTKHLLLGMLREPQTIAARALSKHNVSRERVLEASLLAPSSAAKVLDELRQTFAPMASRLAPETEPVTVFSLPMPGPK